MLHLILPLFPSLGMDQLQVSCDSTCDLHGMGCAVDMMREVALPSHFSGVLGNAIPTLTCSYQLQPPAPHHPSFDIASNTCFENGGASLCNATTTQRRLCACKAEVNACTSHARV